MPATKMKPPEPDAAFEISLRPPMFTEFTGQLKVRERLELMVEAVKKRGDVLEHILVSAPLRSRFGMTARLDYYTADEMQKIILRSGRLLGVDLDTAGAAEIAARCRGTPRTANNLLRWVRDYAQVKAQGKIDKEIADKALAMLEIDRDGF